MIGGACKGLVAVAFSLLASTPKPVICPSRLAMDMSLKLTARFGGCRVAWTSAHQVSADIVYNWISTQWVVQISYPWMEARVSPEYQKAEPMAA